MDSFSNLINTILSSIGSNALIATIIISLFSSMLNKNNSFFLEKLQIKKEILKNAYSPLYKLFCLNNWLTSSEEQLIEYRILALNICDAHIDCIHPNLFIDIKDLCDTEFFSTALYKNIFNIIEKDYFYLRKTIGYPYSNNIFNIKIRSLSYSVYPPIFWSKFFVEICLALVSVFFIIGFIFTSKFEYLAMAIIWLISFCNIHSIDWN